MPPSPLSPCRSSVFTIVHAFWLAAWALPTSAQHAALEQEWLAGSVQMPGAPLEPAAPVGLGVLAEPSSTATLGGATCGRVFSFLPYWANSSTIDFSRHTHVACFAVNVGSDGTVYNNHNWPWTNSIARIRGSGAKVILTVTNFSPSSIRSLVTSASARERFADQLKPLIAGYADGVNIDFEGSTSNGWASFMPGLIAELRAELEPVVPGIEITVATPAVNWGGDWPLLQVAQQADGLFIMGYAYAGPWSGQTGAEAPLTGPGLSLTNSVLNDYGAVVSAMPEKVILGLPLYGQRWRASGSFPGATALAHVSTPTYASARNEYLASGRSWDASSQTPFRSTFSGGSWYQLWVDDAESTALKLDFARDQGLGGIGFWALGYEGTGSSAGEFWSMVDEHYALACEPDPEPAPVCRADLINDGEEEPLLDGLDVRAFLLFQQDQAWQADFVIPGGVSDVMDLLTFLEEVAEGCPDGSVSAGGRSPGRMPF